jgi:hypothetical protein
VEPEEGEGIVEAYRDGRIARLDRYRGRAAHPMPVQAAEVALRRRAGIDRIGDVTMERARRHGERVEVTFGTPAGPEVVRVERTWAAPMRLTCHSPRAEAAAVWRPLPMDGIADPP